MWRVAKNSDDDEIAAMCLALYTEDPSPLPISEQNIHQTLSTLRNEPTRGRAVVLELNGAIGGFAFLISFWSNEVGGEVIVIDELYVKPAFRNQGHARELFRTLTNHPNHLWPGKAVALELEVTPQNQRAAAFYENVGFSPVKNRRMRLSLAG